MNTPGFGKSFIKLVGRKAVGEVRDYTSQNHAWGQKDPAS